MNVLLRFVKIPVSSTLDGCSLLYVCKKVPSTRKKDIRTIQHSRGVLSRTVYFRLLNNVPYRVQREQWELTGQVVCFNSQYAHDK